MKTSKVPIDNGSLFNRLLLDACKKDDINTYYNILNKCDTIIENALLSTVVFSINGIDIDFNNMLIAFSDLFKELCETINLQEREENINKLVEQKVQEKLDDEYYDIFSNISEIQTLIEINKERIENMYE